MKKNIYIMYLIALLQGMVFYGPIATLYRQSSGISVFEITLIESISLVIAIALEIPFGYLADKIGYKKTMIFCSGLYFISKIVFWQAYSFGEFLFERILLGIVCAGFSGVDVGILYLSSPKEKAQKVFGIYNSLSQIGLLIAAAVYALFVGDNYRLAGFLTVISYGLAAVLVFGLKEVKKTEKTSHFCFKKSVALFKEIFLNKRLMLIIIAAALLNETHQIITVFLNQPKFAQSGMTDTAISIVYIIVTVAGSIGVFSSDFTKKLGDRKSGMIIFVVSVLSCIMLAVFKDPITAVLSVLLLRIGFSLFEPLGTRLQNEEITTSDRATALSINSSIINLIAVFTSVIFGKIADINLNYSFAFGAVLLVIGLIMYAVSYKIKKAEL